MKYAIIEIGGKQLWIEPGKYYDINLISDTYSNKIIFNRVLLMHIKDKILIGRPYLNKTTVTGKIINQLKDKKKLFLK